MVHGVAKSRTRLSDFTSLPPPGGYQCYYFYAVPSGSICVLFSEVSQSRGLRVLPGAAPLAFVGSVLQRGVCAQRAVTRSVRAALRPGCIGAGVPHLDPPSPRGHTRRGPEGSARPSCLAGGAGTPAGSGSRRPPPAPAPPQHPGPR